MPSTDASAELPNSPDSFTPAQEKAVDRIVSVLDSTDAILLETHKATTAFFERLLLLNSGTLSLIITVGSAALITSQHPLTLDSGLRHRIVLGCYLLLWSLLCCLLHNYLKLPGLATAMAQPWLTSAGINFKAAGAILPGTVAKSEYEAPFKKARQMGIWAKVIAYTCGGVGILAQILTVAGYFQLVRVLSLLLMSSR